MNGMNLVEQIGEPAALELLAEECVELAHAALKIARIQRGENPTSTIMEEARENFAEEMADVTIVMTDFLSFKGTVFDERKYESFGAAKLERMTQRLGK